MTIDEVIEDLIYDAQCNRADLDIEWAERNEQLAEWLEELKSLRDDYWKVNEICKMYSEIGTVEEFKVLKENRKTGVVCPICGKLGTNRCEECGQDLTI